MKRQQLQLYQLRQSHLSLGALKVGKTTQAAKKEQKIGESIMLPSRNTMPTAVAWNKARYWKEAKRWQLFQRPMLCSRKQARRKHIPQMRWWRQHPQRLPKQRVARMGWKQWKDMWSLRLQQKGGRRGLQQSQGRKRNRSKENLSQKGHRRGLKKSQPDHMRGLKQGHQATRRGLRQSQQGTRMGLRHSQQGTRMGLRQRQQRRRMGLKQSQQKRRRGLKKSQQAADLISHCHRQERNLRKRVPRSRKKFKRQQRKRKKVLSWWQKGLQPRWRKNWTKLLRRKRMKQSQQAMRSNSQEPLGSWPLDSWWSMRPTTMLWEAWKKASWLKKSSLPCSAINKDKACSRWWKAAGQKTWPWNGKQFVVLEQRTRKKTCCLPS